MVFVVFYYSFAAKVGELLAEVAGADATVPFASYD
jgi:hypothetical protein